MRTSSILGNPTHRWSRTRAHRGHTCTRLRLAGLDGFCSLKDDDRLEVRAESDAMIVSGLIALLVRLYSGATRSEILEF